MTAEPNGPARPRNPGHLPTDAEMRTIVDRARRLRAETLAGLARAAWARIARRPAGAWADAPAGPRVGGMPHARA